MVARSHTPSALVRPSRLFDPVCRAEERLQAQFCKVEEVFGAGHTPIAASIQLGPGRVHGL
jgi:hypothetical protein